MADSKMTFDKYIDNPSGGSVFTNRNMYKEMYQKKFDKVLLRENGSIKYQLFTANDGIDSHYVYLKIPSEVVPEFYYDVVIHLFTKNNTYKNEASLRRYTVEFYSNDPAFVYTFAHSFKKNGLFIDDLSPKMSKQALKDKAKVRNPKDDVWYVKSLYFAYLAMVKYNLFSKPMYAGCEKYKKENLLRKITQAETKVAQRQKEGERVVKEKREALEKEKREKRIARNLDVSSSTSRTSNITKTSKISKVSNITKKTKVTKSIGMKKHT